MTETIGSYIEANGATLYYEVQGEGEPLLLLHGMSGCHEDWTYAGRDQFLQEYKLITPDARGHGRSNNPEQTLSHRQCALDTLALLDELGIRRCNAIGLSMGGNTLLHMVTMQPDRIEAMVLVSAPTHFPDQARAIMANVPVDNHAEEEWTMMRSRHHLSDDQIRAIWRNMRELKDSYDDMNFTASELSKITARTLIVYGDRDPLYPVEVAVHMYRAIPNSALWVVPNGGHGPIFLDAAPAFVQHSLAFLR